MKRPSQARAKFTVQAIYDAFVRIWLDAGWAGVTTRAVALEAGFSVGTLYDYFPNKHALLSGYIRHTLEAIQARIVVEVIEPQSLSWQQRVSGLVRLTSGVAGPGLPYFDHDMLQLEQQVAEQKHHQRAYGEFLELWCRAFAVSPDLPRMPDRQAVAAALTAVLGGRRYLLLVEPADFEAERWASDMERLCRAIAS